MAFVPPPCEQGCV